MKISIVIPYYNRRHLLFNCLKSLERQTYQKENFEVVIIDDGSTEEIFEEIKKENFQINYQYKYFARDENSCAATARNRGIALSKGDYIAFIDCDVVCKPNYLTEIEAIIRENNDEEAMFQIGLRNYLLPDIFPDFMKENYGLKNGDYECDNRCRVFELYGYNLASICASWRLAYSCNLVVERSHIEKIGLFDEQFSGWGLEDLEFTYRLYIHNIKPVFNPNIEVYHQHHADNSDDSKDEEWRNNLKYFIQKHGSMQVELQKIFDFSGTCDDTWIQRFIMYEEVIRIIKEKQILKDKIYIPIENVEQLRALTNKYQNKTLVCLCKKTNHKLIYIIQTKKEYERTGLLII